MSELNTEVVGEGMVVLVNLGNVYHKPATVYVLSAGKNILRTVCGSDGGGGVLTLHERQLLGDHCRACKRCFRLRTTNKSLRSR